MSTFTEPVENINAPGITKFIQHNKLSIIRKIGIFWHFLFQQFEGKMFRTNGDCFNVLDTDYKFYLAFENSNCIDYITEKFYVNGLGYRFSRNSVQMQAQKFVMCENAQQFKEKGHIYRFQQK